MEQGDATAWLSTVETGAAPEIRSYREDVAAWIRGFSELRQAVSTIFGKDETASITGVLGPIPHPTEVGRLRRDRIRNDLVIARKHGGGLVTVDGIPYMKRGNHWLERVVEPRDRSYGPTRANDRREIARTLGDAGRAAEATADRLSSGDYSLRQAVTILSWEYFRAAATRDNPPSSTKPSTLPAGALPVAIDLSTPRHTFETYARALAAHDPEAMLACFETNQQSVREYVYAYARLLSSSDRFRMAAEARFGVEHTTWLVGAIGLYAPMHVGKRMLQDLERTRFEINGDIATVHYLQSNRAPDRMVRVRDNWKFALGRVGTVDSDVLRVPSEFESATVRNNQLATEIEAGSLESPLDAALSVINADRDLY